MTMEQAQPDIRDDGPESRQGAPARTRLLYHSSNGDSWLLIKDDTGRVAVEHRANAPSGGNMRIIGLAEFLRPAHPGPEHAELVRLIGTLVDAAEAGAETS